MANHRGYYECINIFIRGWIILINKNQINKSFLITYDESKNIIVILDIFIYLAC